MADNFENKERKKYSKNKKLIENPVFICSAIVAVAIVVWAIAGRDSFEAIGNYLFAQITSTFSGLYLWGMLIFVIFCFVLAFSPLGKKRLGSDDERPRYGTISWFAMLFAAGMGIGLVFWGVSEPLSHYISPMAGIDPASEASKAFAFRSTFMHWGLHPWAGYSIMGLGLAIVMFRLKKSALVSNLLEPITGTGKASKVLGGIVNVYTVILTIFGIASSLGVGCLQICDGANFILGIPNEVWVWLIMIAVICVVYTLSSISGVDSGIKKLSNINIVLFVILLVFVFIAGPEAEIIKNFGVGIKDYLVNFFPDSVRAAADNGDASWVQGWRVFYWAWWLSWAPFVGMFVAKISRGRTIREFVIGVIVVPTLVSTIWFSVFGTAGISVADRFSPDELAIMTGSPQTALFRVFAEYPLGLVISVVALILLVIFFITSADSATYVLSMATSNGSEDPPASKKVFWAILIAATAFALILSGGLSVIQNVAISMSFPYMILMLIICISIIKLLVKEPPESGGKKKG